MICYGRGTVSKIMVKIQTRVVKKSTRKASQPMNANNTLSLFQLVRMKKSPPSFLNLQLDLKLRIEEYNMNLKLKKQKSKELQNGKSKSSEKSCSLQRKYVGFYKMQAAFREYFGFETFSPEHKQKRTISLEKQLMQK